MRASASTRVDARTSSSTAPTTSPGPAVASPGASEGHGGCRTRPGAADAWGYASPRMRENLEGKLRGASTRAGRLPLPRRGGRRPVRREGEIAALAGAQLLPARRRAVRRGAARRARGRRRGHRHAHRGRGAPPRAEPRQASPAAVQHSPPRRQVVPVHRGDTHGRVPARDVHARAAPARNALLRPVREREEGAGDPRRAQPRLPLPPLRRACVPAATPGSPASTSTSTAASRRVSERSRRRATPR